MDDRVWAEGAREEVSSKRGRASRVRKTGMKHGRHGKKGPTPERKTIRIELSCFKKLAISYGKGRANQGGGGKLEGGL